MKYIVGIREVHVNYIDIETDETDESIIKKLAEKKATEDMGDIYMEYSHTLDPDVWSIEKVK